MTEEPQLSPFLQGGLAQVTLNIQVVYQK